jgi:glucose-1-phosphate cytidylyltransferase
MKAVLLAGGLGTRMREETEFRPKPMVEIGGMPVLWHIMKMLSHHGIREFVVLTGYKGELITSFFSNLPTMRKHIHFDYSRSQPFSVITDEPEETWKVDVVATGIDTPTGGRLLEAREVIGKEPFICTYGDGLADVDITRLIGEHKRSGQIATMTVFQPTNRFGVVEITPEGSVSAFREKPAISDWVNIGFFVFANEIFSYLDKRQMLEEEPLINLAKDGKLRANKHSGFWEPMDTYREYQKLNALWEQGNAPWKTW